MTELALGYSPRRGLAPNAIPWNTIALNSILLVRIFMIQAIEETNAGATENVRHLERFEQVGRNRSEPAWLAPLRESGRSSFARRGFPTVREEDWRFTNVAPIARLPLRPADQVDSQAAAEASRNAALSEIPGLRLVFVNGHFSPALSRKAALPAGVKVGSLAAGLQNAAPLLQEHLGRHAGADHNPFAALNQAYFTDGAFIHVPAGVEVPEPIQLVFVSAATETGTVIQPRVLVVAEANSKVTVIENFTHAARAVYFTNAVTEVVAGDNASVELLKFQDEALDAFHMATLHGRFGRSSNVIAHSFALGGRLSRNNIHVTLAGEGLECTLNGLYLTRGEQLADHHIGVEHAQPHCASHEYFNGILDDKSRGVFHGRILVRPVAQKTDAKQTNKNLLLSDDAAADAKPQLEIYADDVKCTHGATVGQLNDESIFYLRSRGLDRPTARRMLIHAFAGEIIERIRCDAAREELDRLIWDRLEANPHLAEAK